MLISLPDERVITQHIDSLPAEEKEGKTGFLGSQKKERKSERLMLAGARPDEEGKALWAGARARARALAIISIIIVFCYLFAHFGRFVPGQPNATRTTPLLLNAAMFFFGLASERA